MSRTLLIVAALAGIIGCGGGSSSVTAPSPEVATLPTLPTPTSGSTLANWIGDATVLSASNAGGCGWGRTPGETRSGVLWRVVIDGSTVSLDEDMGNWPTDHITYSGTLTGVQFTATYNQPIDGVCQFASGTLSGNFSNDFSTFEAEETLVWGEGDNATRVQRRWRAKRR